MMSQYVNVWRLPVTHACAGDGKTLCGVECYGLAGWDEGGNFDARESETYVSCKRCLRCIAAAPSQPEGEAASA